MAKTKTIKHHLTPVIAGLSVTLAVGIIVAGSHLSEVVAHAANLPQTAGVMTGDTSRKVTGELHNHIEKQTLKTITKVMGDDLARTDRRHIKHKLKARKVKMPQLFHALLA